MKGSKTIIKELLILLKIYNYFLLKPISRSRASQDLSKKEFELFERSEFLNSRQIREAQEIR
jgi:hypothetical protein